ILFSGKRSGLLYKKSGEFRHKVPKKQADRRHLCEVHGSERVPFPAFSLSFSPARLVPVPDGADNMASLFTPVPNVP
ncbi:MAG: hypothetical protein ABTB30_10525, partial [Clostridia bacterium]